MTTTPEGRLDPPAPRQSDPSAFAALLRRLHFYAGVFVGPFLMIAAVSGGLYAIAPSIEQFVYRDHLHVTTSGDWRPVAEQIRAAQALRPDLTVTAVRPAGESGETTRVLFDDPALGESERRAVFVDPATAQPIGDLPVYGSSGALPVRTWIDQLHRSLHLGEPGRVYSELAASWLWVITLAGVGLWWARGRRGRRLLTVDRAARGRTRTLHWHGAVGLWIAAGLLFLSATGLTWSHYAGDNIAALRTALSWTTPTVSTAVGAPGHGHHDGHVTPGGDAPRVDEVDRVLRVARDAGVAGHVEVSIPAGADTAFTVAQTREPWVMSTNAVAVDGSTGQVTDTSWFADWPLAAKLSAWGIQLHMGLLFGLVSQVGLAVLAAALVTVIVRGYLMWWRRRPTRGGGTAGRPPTRGVLRGVSPAAVVVLVCAAVAVGWFVPLLGLSLLAFVAVDAAIGFAQRRNAGGGSR
ncbi:peptidase [Mycobacterium sp. IS-1742]|uniref:PepSY-associated TM helix domain-containing protein n=1 Tax=Mycobacterium sp. IS-1742 TaxID=1772285 RepID=UPI0007401DD7|nr:PepSY domain-containing protein [Mycobacterium sp. IS-1742]KUI24772.1 peptidase [Mycobacterium sp. IS-1742]